jgi:hypothetical protein
MIESTSCHFQLCFKPLRASGRGFAFPCDPDGQVNLDHMSERSRNDYFFARGMMGREVSYPEIATLQ